MKSTINNTLLTNNIEKIKYYASEENDILNKICLKFKVWLNDYDSPNSLIITNNTDKLYDNINKISDKRENYIRILNEVIKEYYLLSEDTINIFNGDN